jgi:hypothetical protein
MRHLFLVLVFVLAALMVFTFSTSCPDIAIKLALLRLLFAI